MRQKYLLVLLSVLFCMISTISSAHDIELQNDDGVMIYYKYINNSTELAVTFRGTSWSSYHDEYSGSVVVPDKVIYNGQTLNVTSIGDSAFDSCSGLITITIPNSVTSIGSWAFNGCLGLTSITIPNSVTSIRGAAFSGCSNLQSVTIGNGVTNIGESVFEGCSGLTEITIGKGVTSIEQEAFKDCMNLTKVELDCNEIISKNYNDKNSSGIRFLFGSQVQEYVLGENVTSIGNGTFNRCSSLISITIPNSVTNIGDYAFLDCSELSSITIPNNVINIGSYAFGFCSRLTSITIPNSVTSIGKYAFHGCSDLTSIIVEKDNSIYDSRDNCNAIIETASNTLILGCPRTTISNSVTSIGDAAFLDCYSLTSIIIPNSVTSIGGSAFRHCSSLATITIPNSVRSIGDAAFSNCSSLATITIPNSVRSIGDGAFAGTAWYDNQPNGIVYAGKNIYKYKGAMPDNTSIVIDEGTYCIVGNAFSNCSGLISVTIPNSVTSIGFRAFSSCSSLTSVTIGNGVTEIGREVFKDCPNITWVKLNNNYLVSVNRDCFGNQVKEYVLGECVTSIGDNAFYGCSNLISIIIPNSVISIGKWAFYGCSGLTSITIPNDVTEIGQEVFKECSGLTSIIIPNSVTSIGNWAFYGCSGLTSIIIPNSVTSIGFRAFSSCSGLTSVTIGNGVTNIGYEVFKDCPNITWVKLNNNYLVSANRDCFENQVKEYVLGECVTRIENGSFYGCSSLTSITLPSSITSIGDAAFYGCSSLTSITLPSSVTSIGDAAFYGCSSLSSITIPNSVTSIGGEAFDNTAWYDNQADGIVYAGRNVYKYKGTMPDNTSIIINEGTIGIAGSAFSKCSSLTSITIPNSVTSIGSFTFNNCSNLTLVTIGNSMTSIGDGAFWGCSGLADMYCNSEKVPEMGNSVFVLCNLETATLHVPKASVKAYSEAEQWKIFGEIIRIPLPSHKLIYIVDGEEYKTYEIEEEEYITPEAEPEKEGYTFSGWSEIPETMPAHDVTVTGTFFINKYKLIYMVDDAEYKTYEVEYGTTITPEAEPKKEGYTFSGWSEIPETMPAHDVTVTGTFFINKYKLIYMVDDAEYKTYEVEYGTTITPEAEPKKEGYTFSGWSEIPEIMPAHDVTITGTFSLDSGFIQIMSDNNGDEMIFRTDGKRIKKLQNGLNIIRLKDGSTRKVMKK